MINVYTIPVLKDNYTFVLHDKKSKETVVIDPSIDQAVLDFLERKQWRLTAIWNTHHHWDHTGGNLGLKEKTFCKIWGPEDIKNPIPGIDVYLKDGDTITIGEKSVSVMETPGHTSIALCFWIKEDKMLFSGDTLFSLGCGRLFEGTAEQLWKSLQKIKKLPPDTLIYAAHEYTEQNALFALSVDPQNKALQKYQTLIKEKRKRQEPTLPTLLETELKTNPFLRTNTIELKEKTKTVGLKEWETFEKLRNLKDSF